MPLPRLRPTALRTVLAAAVLLIATAAAATPAPARVTPADASARVLVLGDSLAVGLKPFLGDLLGADVAWDAKDGRTTPQGLMALRSDLRVVAPTVVVVSLGTNDGPDPSRFVDRIDRALAAIGPDACVVWSDIHRPARKGPYAALNGALGLEAARVARLHLVAWDRAVLRRAVRLPDGLHPDEAGYAYRAKLIAQTVRSSCGTTRIGGDGRDRLGDDTTGGAPAPS